MHEHHRPASRHSLLHQGFQRASVDVSDDAQSTICRELLGYWDRIRTINPIPQLTDIDLDELGDIASWLTIKDIGLVESGQIQYRNRYWGANLSRKLGFDGNNQILTDYSGTRGGHAMSTIYGMVVEHAAPVLSTGFLEFINGCEDVGYEAIFLPLAAAGSPLPAHIIAAYDFSFEPERAPVT